MGNSLRQPDRMARRVLPEIAQKMAKAASDSVRKAEMDSPDLVWRRAVGRMVEAMRRARGLTLDEFAGKLKKDPRQIGRWEKGIERAQLDVILAVEEFHQPLLLAFAALLDSCEIRTTIHVLPSRRAVNE